MTTTTTALVPTQPVFSDAERLALAGFLAGYRGLTREAYALDLRQFTTWCRTSSLNLFAVRRAEIESFARELEARGRARATVTRRLCTIAGFCKYAVGAGHQRQLADSTRNGLALAEQQPGLVIRMEPQPDSPAEYAEMTGWPVRDEIQQRHLGLPLHLLSASLLSWDGIAEVTAALRLSVGGTLADLACGRGGYGLEIAARTGARLVGIDLSAEACARPARPGGWGATADCRVGDLAATGLGAGPGDAVLCGDAIHFAPLQAPAARSGVLAPGGAAARSSACLSWAAVRPARAATSIPGRAGDVAGPADSYLPV